MYAIFSPRAVVKIKGRIKVTTLLDIKTDINIMTAEIANAINLLILEIIPIKAKIFTGYNT
jgi:hypothetical protein